MKKCGYIEDGYTRPGFISDKEKNGDDRPFPALRFDYRPMLYKDRRKILKSFDSPNQPLIAAEAIVARLPKWDLMKPTRDESGKIIGEEVVAINKEEMLRVHPELMDTLFNIICGITTSDVDPLWSQEEERENEEAELAAAISGTDPGYEREEADAKNSGSG